MKRRFRKYRRKLKKRLLIASTRVLNLFTKRSKPRISHGNKVTLIPSGKDAFIAFLAMIDAAAYYIDLEYYIFRDDRYGNLIAEKLMKKAREGVKVTLLYDYIGCIDTTSTFFQHLVDNGIEVIVFNPVSLRTNPLNWEKRDHRKMAVFDGRTAVVSGWNIGKEYFEGTEDSMRDVGVVLEGPCIKALQQIFNRVYEQQTGRKRRTPVMPEGHPAGNDEVWVIESGPRYSFRAIYNAYRLAIMTAQECVLIENAYFVPPRALVKDLLNSVRRGDNVKIILPDKIDVPLVKYASYNFFSLLLKAGIRIYERSRMILHSKIACIDNIWVTIGSTNLHRRSFDKNYELNIVVISKKFGEDVMQFISDDIAESREITMDQWINRPFSQKIKEKIAAVFSFFL